MNPVEASVALQPDSHITLDALDRNKIPESERFDWQPDDLVAMIGTHQLRNWQPIYHLAFHPSGEFFVCSAPYSHTQVWSTRTLERLMGSEDGGISPDWKFCFMPDGKSFVSNSGKYSIDLSQPDHPKFKLIAKRRTHTVSEQLQMVVSPDGNWLMIAGAPAGSLEVWNISGDGFRFVKEVSYPTRSYTHFMNLSRDGRRLALYADGTAEVPQAGVLLWDIDWDAADGPSLKQFAEPISGYFSALSPDGQTLVTSPFGGSETSQVLDLSGSSPKVVAELPGSQLIAFAMQNNNEVWNLSDPTPKKIASDLPRFSRFAPQGQSALIYGWDWTISSQPWEITKRGVFRLDTTPTEFAKTMSHASAQLAADRLSSLRPELKRYVDVQDEGKLPVLELSSDHKLLFEVQHPLKMISTFSLSADGSMLAAFPHSEAGNGMVWDFTETPPREY